MGCRWRAAERSVPLAPPRSMPSLSARLHRGRRRGLRVQRRVRAVDLVERRHTEIWLAEACLGTVPLHGGHSGGHGVAAFIGSSRRCTWFEDQEGQGGFRSDQDSSCLSGTPASFRRLEYFNVSNAMAAMGYSWGSQAVLLTRILANYRNFRLHSGKSSARLSPSLQQARGGLCNPFKLGAPRALHSEARRFFYAQIPAYLWWVVWGHLRVCRSLTAGLQTPHNPPPFALQRMWRLPIFS